MLHSAGILAMSPILETAGYLLLLLLGFSFVIIIHELGHFLAAKWAGVRVEQFALGMFHALVSWRKGIGFRIGKTQREYKKRVYAHVGRVYPDKGEPADPLSDVEVWRIGDELGLGQTEYRINWAPIGGYVKMVGQDDSQPNAEFDAPYAYNKKSIGKRMVIVSAGVVMNVILAAIGFMILFSIGFNVPPTKVGTILPNSPAQAAGLQVGDRILQLDGKDLHNDYTKLTLNVALSANNEEIPLVVARPMPDGSEQIVRLTVKPTKADMGGTKLVGMGVGMYADLKGMTLDEGRRMEETKDPEKHVQKNARIIKPGDVITAVNGTPVAVTDYAVLDAYVQAGRPVTLTIKGHDGVERQETFDPQLASPFGAKEFSLLGMVPRLQIGTVTGGSPLIGKAQTGDVILLVRDEKSTDAKSLPTFDEFSGAVNAAANAGLKVRLTVLRNGQQVEIDPIEPIKVRRGVYGVGVGLMVDEHEPTIAHILPNSPAAALALQAKSTITAVAGRPVSGWRDLHLTLRKIIRDPARPAHVDLAYTTEGGEAKTAKLHLTDTVVAAIDNVRYDHDLMLVPTKQVRLADGVVQATQWGVIETRDFILQFYVTLRRMVTGDVGAENLMGPVGIFQTGTNIAAKGPDWLIWFLSMISANLAVVNFLPIPIVDGGLFVFLLLEKIKGRPASPRTQAIAQYVGLALLLSIFVFVTWQDIANFSFR